MLARHLLAELKVEHDQLMEQIERLEDQIKAWHVNNSVSQRLASIPGIGVLTASALVATVGEGQDFSNGRQLAAYLGLVPRQASSGGKVRLLGISKRGDGVPVAAIEGGVDGGAVDALGPPLFEQTPVGFEARLCLGMRRLGLLKDGDQFLVRWQWSHWVEPALLMGLLTQRP